ncbi:tetratricopeptide repeat-containing sulfotransferase family protein [Roseospira goensis]|uniref:Tetratricopeptide (TPR) repeat protein n=1 Tax=Roseospira goensis TaxID=391922 RepID=A0A7W6S1R9_9PROT|nr:tetratricopeptide repeat-containing sulfotransferase family protein [Roseospira goensis]MBB4287298.1 tetratricopeptide (TPR) repeat protein [Roseospira goensis]
MSKSRKTAAPKRPAAGTLSHLVPGAQPAVGAGRPDRPGGADPRRLAAEGHRHLAQGDPRAAEPLFRQALARDDRCAAALGGLGIVAARAGHLEDAARLFHRAAAVEPSVPDHALNAASALWHLGRRDAALTVLAEVARAAPRVARVRVAHGKALVETGALAAAEAEARAALDCAPHDGAALALLGRALLRAGRAGEAVAPLRAAVAAAPADTGAANDLAMALSALDRRAEAVTVLRAAVKTAHTPRDRIFLDLNLAGTLLADQRADEAETVLDDLLRRAPDHVGVHLTLGDARQRQGRFEAARAAYHAALEREPGNVLALRGLVKSGRIAAGDPVLDTLRAAAQAERAPRTTRIEALFALGKALDDAGADPAETFAAFTEANALQRQGRPDDIPDRATLVDRSIAVFTPARIAALAGLGSDSTRPVFIVGLPRSGTSLIEQMIASHPAVVGAGELGTLPRVQGDLPARLGTAAPYPDCLADLDPPAARDPVAAAAADVLAALDAAAHRAGTSDALRISDKLPDNAMRLGLIALLFPQARVIVCRRDPLDTGLSLFQQNFSDGIPYANGLETIGQAMIQHDRLMAHWRAVLPLEMLTVDYETLVHDLEGEGRRLIGFLGLPWDDAVLRFHETDRAVYTASKWQVRQPVFTASVGRWRRYADQLAPLRAVLEPAGLLDRPV